MYYKNSHISSFFPAESYKTESQKNLLTSLYSLMPRIASTQVRNVAVSYFVALNSEKIWNSKISDLVWQSVLAPRPGGFTTPAASLKLRSQRYVKQRSTQYRFIGIYERSSEIGEKRGHLAFGCANSDAGEKRTEVKQLRLTGVGKHSLSHTFIITLEQSYDVFSNAGVSKLLDDFSEYLSMNLELVSFLRN